MLLLFVIAAVGAVIGYCTVARFIRRKHRGAAGPVQPRVWSDPEGPRSAEASSATAAPPTYRHQSYHPATGYVPAERSSGGGDAFLGSLAGSFIGSSIADACSNSSSNSDSTSSNSCDSSFGGCD